MSFQVNIKWGKRKFENVEIDTNETPLVFKSQIFALSGVLPENQKIMVKGGTLKDEADWTKVGIKPGQTLMMMGTATEDMMAAAPKEKPVFIEDMNEDDVDNMDMSGFPPGLANHGNTCYLNASLQALKVVPQLKSKLLGYSASGSDPSHNITSSLGLLYNQLEAAQRGPQLEFSLNAFIQAFRRAFPQFEQRSGMTYAQQDAEEFLGQLLRSLSEKLPGEGASADRANAIDELFGVELESTLVNAENPDEPPEEPKKEFVRKLSCHIGAKTAHLMEGLRETLQDQDLEKFSPSLNRNARYLKVSKITRMPGYIMVNYVRFFWKQSEQVRCKIMKPVSLPMELDLYQLCTEDLKSELNVSRRKELAWKDKKLADEARARGEPVPASSAEEKEKEKTGGDGEAKDGAADKDVEMVDESELKDLLTARYSLVSVVSHKGRTADAGHYVGWVKNGEKKDDWLMFDDDAVHPVVEEDIKKLAGGGDWHMAYICVYKRNELS